MSAPDKQEQAFNSSFSTSLAKNCHAPSSMSILHLLNHTLDNPVITAPSVHSREESRPETRTEESMVLETPAPRRTHFGSISHLLNATSPTTSVLTVAIMPPVATEIPQPTMTSSTHEDSEPSLPAQIFDELPTSPVLLGHSENEMEREEVGFGSGASTQRDSEVATDAPGGVRSSIQDSLSQHNKENWGTYAGRNPLKEAIPTQTNPNRKKLAPATRSARKAVCDKNNSEYLEEIQNILRKRENDIKDIAKRFNKSESQVKINLNHATNYKKGRNETLWNAKLHYVGQKMNEGLAIGCRHSRTEILEGIKEYGLDDLDTEEEEELRERLRQHRNLKKTGARANNVAVGLDFEHVVSKIGMEISNLSERTGAVGFVLLSRGHCNDGQDPSWVECEGASGFIMDTFHLTAVELGRKFDSWCVARSGNSVGGSSIRQKTQAECGKIILDQLRLLLNNKSVNMSYSNYDEVIRNVHGVELQNWPSNIFFAPPSTITSTSDALLLLDALQTGECKWVQMSPSDLSDLRTSLRKKPGKQRATRRDKGVPRKRKNKPTDESEPSGSNNAQPKKKQRTENEPSSAIAQLPPSLTSLIEEGETDEEESVDA